MKRRALRCRRPTVAVVGPENLVAAGVSRVLESAGVFEAIAAGESAESALEHFERGRIDVVLFYASAPCTGGALLIDELGRAGQDTAFLAVVERDDALTARACVRAGATAVIESCSRPAELLEALRACRERRRYFPHAVTRSERPDIEYAALTRRERQVLGEIGSGYTSRAIAERLGIAYKTVDAHRQNIARKLEARNMAQLVKHAIRAGLTTLEI